MTGRATWTQARREYQSKLSKAQEFHETADLKRENASTAGDLVTLRQASEKLASSSKSNLCLAKKIESWFGDSIEELQAFKDRTEFAARHRDFVSDFEDDVFYEFSESGAAAAFKLDSKAAVLSVLAKLTREARRSDQWSRKFVMDHQPVKQAWCDAVKAKGLRLNHYDQLRAFKNDSNVGFHGSEEARDALKLLESAAPLPGGLEHLREPLIALLKLLS